MAYYARSVEPVAGFESPAEAELRLQAVRAAFLVVLALFTYLAVPLVSGGRVLVPSFPTFALAPILFLLVWPSLSRTDWVFLPKIGFMLIATIALSPGYEYVQQKFLGLIQCVLAIAVAVLTVRLMRQIRPSLLERALLVAWGLIVVGSILEILDIIRAPSDAFRAWAYGDVFTLYGSDLRDTNMVGWPRPKLFSVEPSDVTKIFIATVNAWLLVRVTWFKAAVAAIATLGMLTIMGSPMFIISVAITGAIVMWNRQASFRAKATMVFLSALIGVIFAAFFGGSTTYTNITDRVANVGNTAPQGRVGSSEQRRMVYPYVTLADTWRHSPLFGVGMSGKELLLENTSLPVTRPQDALGNNVMAEVGVYFGLLGGMWFCFLLSRQARHLGVRRLSLLAAFFILFSQLMGGIETFKYWGFMSLLWGALAVADIRAEREAAEAEAEDEAEPQTSTA